MMKRRTVEEIYDQEIGHKRFAEFIRFAQLDGYTISEIKEYYSKFKFKMNGYPMEYDKTVKFDSKWFLSLCEMTIFSHQELEKLQEEK